MLSKHKFLLIASIGFISLANAVPNITVDSIDLYVPRPADKVYDGVAILAEPSKGKTSRAEVQRYSDECVKGKTRDDITGRPSVKYNNTSELPEGCTIQLKDVIGYIVKDNRFFICDNKS